MDFLPYAPHLAARARELRRNSTLGEVLLWRLLRRGQRRGVDFHRQRPIDRFIVDFYAPAVRLAVEIDGGTHLARAEGDVSRQRSLEALGVRFLRFSEAEVRRNPEAIAGAIDAWLIAVGRSGEGEGAREHTPPCGHPSLEGIDTPRPAATPLKRGSSPGPL